MSEANNYDALPAWEEHRYFECPYEDCGQYVPQDQMKAIKGTYIVECPTCGRPSKYYKVP